MKAVIFDMDGTLCDVSSIRYHVNPKDPRFSGKKRFDRFHTEAIDCPPNDLAMDLYRWAKAAGHAVVVVTARMGFWAIPTLLWLKENDVEHDALYMRTTGDTRKDVIVKQEILQQILDDGYEPILAVDDNPSVIAMWQEQGIETTVIPGWEENP